MEHSKRWLSFLVTFILLLIEHRMDAFVLLPSKSLIPSQVLRSSKENQKPASSSSSLSNNRYHSLLVPSSVISSQHQLPTKLQASASIGSITGNGTVTRAITTTITPVSRLSKPTGTMPANKTSQHRRKKGRRRAQNQKHKLTSANSNTTATTVAMNTDTSGGTPPALDSTATGQQQQRRRYSSFGNLPDIHWRAVSLEHLRQHPRFQSLPSPRSIHKIESLEDVRMFRQESWQWDALHNGRCTTSQAVAALGFLEPAAGEALGVPFSWRRGSIGAFYRLRKPALRTVADMNKILCDTGGGGGGDDDDDDSRASSGSASVSQLEATPIISTMAPLWEDAVEGSSFYARYRANTTKAEISERKSQASKYAQSGHLGTSIRMMWGNTQEATALLTALNYFSSLDDKCDIVLREVGMCGAGLDLNQTNARSSLLVGATPDAVLVHGDGTIEALEVKNHCPFTTSNWKSKMKRKGKGGGNKNFSVRDYPFDVEKAGVFSHYIPQLMMEMLCIGPECRSAVMVRQTATQGAMVLRMNRDDVWLDEMLYWLHRFQRDYVETGITPPQDVFWSGEEKDSARYRTFVNHTLEIRDKVEVVSHIPNDMIQRKEEDASFFLD